MADNKKYYYLKLKDNFYDSEEMIILQNMQDGYLYSDILLKLYLRSLKNEGKLMFNNIIPYTPQVLSQVVRHQVGTVEKALDIFKKLGLIEILDNGAIYMLDIQNFIGQSSSEADRRRKYYNKIKLENDSCEISHDNSTPEIEIEKEIDIDIDIEKDIEINKEIDIDIDKKNKNNKSSIEIFESLIGNYRFNPGVIESIREWFTYKQEKKEKYTETGVKSLLKQLEKHWLKYGDAAIINLIDESMGNNYKGICFDKLKYIKEEDIDPYAGWPHF